MVIGCMKGKKGEMGLCKKKLHESVQFGKVLALVTYRIPKCNAKFAVRYMYVW
jgi:hypothetical protein